VRYSLENPQAYIDANVNGFMNILECCRHHKVEGLIYASSSSVYGGNTKFPFSVDDRVVSPVSIYAASKKANELMAHSYHHLFGLHTTGLRFFTVYGPWGRPDMAYFSFTEKISKGEEISVFNNGKMNRDFTYIDDIVDGTISALNENHPFEIFNLGNSKTENLVDVINLIETSLGVEAKIIFKPIQPGDVFETYADINHSKKKLNFSPKTSIQVGVPKFIEWFRSYYEI